MEQAIYRFDEVLDDGFNVMLLGDPYTLLARISAQPV